MKFNGHILAQEYSTELCYTGVLSFEKGFIFQIHLSSIDQTTQKDWIFFVKGHKVD